MSTTADEIEWDFFLAHAGPDKGVAEALFDHLSKTSRVFLDSRCLVLGDDWDAALATAQRKALVTVVLISKNTVGAYYQREEVAAAIAFARENRNRHRVVPVYLNIDPEQANVPYGLRLKHGISLGGSIDVFHAATRLLDLLRHLSGKSSDSSKPTTQQASGESTTSGGTDLRPSTPGVSSTKQVSPERLYAEGKTQYLAGDFSRAYDSFERAAEEDHHLAQIALGYMHIDGKGCYKDIAKAESWFKYVADRGNVLGLYWLYVIHTRRHNDFLARNNKLLCPWDPYPASEDERQAIALVKAAAQMGLAAAQCDLGVRYMQGRGVPQDFGLAMENYRKAADQGNDAAMGNIKELYEKGFGVAEDPVKAAIWKRKSTEQVQKNRSRPPDVPWMVK